MAARYRVRVTEIAASQIREAADWWQVNRPVAPEALADDVEAAFELIALQPGIGSAARSPLLPGVRRVLLARIRYHVFYRVSPIDEAVDVLAFWHSSSGAAPDL